MNAEFMFLAPGWLFGLWLPALLLPLLLVRETGYIAKLSMHLPREKASIAQTASKRRLSIILYSASLICILTGLARPAWGYPDTNGTRSGRDIAFVIDVSRSMLAEDLYPNRLERAKLAIQDLVETLDGNRVALVAFGGTAVIKCPLTRDYSFFLSALRDLSPSSVSRGGSLIGDALRKTSRDVLRDEGTWQDIFLISDGEDQDSLPLKAAEEIAERGIRIIAIGLGDDSTGSRIPVTRQDGRSGYLSHQGKEVWSKLDPETLRHIAFKTPGGRYLNVATGNFELDKIYRTLKQDAETRETGTRTDMRLVERFQLFLAAAYLFAFAALFLAERRLR